MTDTNINAGGRPPTNQLAANTYNPIAGATTSHPKHFPIGTPVAQSTLVAGTAIPAQADDIDTALVTGLAVVPGVAGEPVLTQLSGPVTLTTAQWDAITGQVGGLTPGVPYFLDAATEGKLTTTAPGGGGDFVTPVGIGLTARDFLIQICRAQPA